MPEFEMITITNGHLGYFLMSLNYNTAGNRYLALSLRRQKKKQETITTMYVLTKEQLNQIIK